MPVVCSLHVDSSVPSAVVQKLQVRRFDHQFKLIISVITTIFATLVALVLLTHIAIVFYVEGKECLFSLLLVIASSYFL